MAQSLRVRDPLVVPAVAHREVRGGGYADLRPVGSAHEGRPVLRPGRCPSCGRGEQRTGQQNKLMWAILHRIASRAQYHGQWLDEDEWKCLFTAGLKQQKVLPGLEGGFVVMPTSTKQMSKEEHATLCDLMMAWAAQNDVDLSDLGV